MILIEINRYTIMKLEEAIEKYNNDKETHFARITTYVDMINKLLDNYVKEKVIRNQE